MNIFVLNAGSSSLKYRLYRMEDQCVLAQGGCERIGIDGKIKYANHKGVTLQKPLALPDHGTAFRHVVTLLTTGDTAVLDTLSDIDAVGHRIVHGGVSLIRPTLVNEETLKEIQSYEDYAPLHTPAQVSTIQACIKLLGADKPQVCVFDTAFHQTMPPEAFVYGVPYRYYEEYGVRRYGFHGISHSYVSERAAKLLERDIRGLRIVSCHLGNGSSVCAVQGGRSVECSMGFGPSDGVIMGTRCGAVDPTALFYIAKRENLSVDELADLVSKKSGLLGLSGISSDDREVENAMFRGDEKALLVRKIQCRQVRKFIGSYSFIMGGLDVIIFTAGLGENSPNLREKALEGLENYGIRLDPVKNERMKHGAEGDISDESAPVRIMVIPTNEEWKIALDTAALLRDSGVQIA